MNQPDLERTCRILVIDDHRDSAAALGLLLRRYGHDVEVAYDGVSGLESARRFRPTIVICDLELPGMDGYELASEIKRDRSLAPVRVIALSGHDDAEAILRAKEAGFDEHMSKPVEPAKLKRAIGSPHEERGESAT